MIWSQKEIDKLKNMVDNGCSIPQITIEFDYRTKLSIRQKINKEFGAIQKRWSKAEDEIVINGYRNGETAKKIATYLPGRTPCSISCRARQGLGISWNKKKYQQYAPFKDEVTKKLSAGFPMSIDELAISLNTRPLTIRKVLNKYNDFYIEKWVRRKKNLKENWISLWSIGNKKSQKKPKPLTQSELCKKYREKEKCKENPFGVIINQITNL